MDRREFLRTATLAAGSLLVAPGVRAQDAAGAPLFAFAALADPHLAENRAGEPKAAEKLQRALTRALEQTPKPDFALLLGDLHADPMAAFLPTSPLPLHAVFGNHETVAARQKLRPLFADFGEKDCYAFTHHDCRFIALATATATGDHIGHFESEFLAPKIGQIEWLEDELRRSRKLKHRFVYAHIPPEPNNEPTGMHLGSLESRYFHHLLRREPVSACFFGHLHLHRRYEASGCPVIGVPSCNWNFPGEPTGFYHVRVFADRVEPVFVAL